MLDLVLCCIFLNSWVSPPLKCSEVLWENFSPFEVNFKVLLSGDRTTFTLGRIFLHKWEIILLSILPDSKVFYSGQQEHKLVRSLNEVKKLFCLFLTSSSFSGLWLFLLTHVWSSILVKTQGKLFQIFEVLPIYGSCLSVILPCEVQLPWPL